MSKRPWYKRYPSDFIAGTLQLSCEEKGAYSVVLDLIYDRGGPIPDDARWIARVCNLSTRRWNQIRARLLELGKVTARDGVLTNKRALSQLKVEEKEHISLSSAGKLGAEKTNERRGQPGENKDLEKKGPPGKKRHTRYQILDTRKKENPLPLEGDILEVDFKAWYSAYPRKVAPGAARKAYRAARKKTDAATLLAGVVTYQAAKPGYADWKHPATWLTGECWADEDRPDNLYDHPAYPGEYEGDLRRDYDMLKGFTERGFWLSDWGPKPGEDGCGIAPEVMAKHGEPS